MKRLIALVVMIFVAGCTEASREKMFSLGGSRHIICYSGGVKIYEGHSSGKISSEETSDGYYFKDKETGKLIEVSGDCVMQY